MSSHIMVSVVLCILSCEPANVWVWDGDSIRVGWSNRAEAIRISNIDAPEIEGQCAYESDLAQRSKNRLAELLQGQQVTIYPEDTDRYGRTLATVTVNGMDVGDVLVSEGLARTWSGRREPWC